MFYFLLIIAIVAVAFGCAVMEKYIGFYAAYLLNLLAAVLMAYELAMHLMRLR